MQLPRGLARFNKHVTNRVQGLWASRMVPWAVVIHRGRKSGHEYRTPVLGWREGDRFYIALYYGAQADWIRNVLAAGRADLVRHGRTHTLTGPQVVDTATLTELPAPVRLAARPAAQTLVMKLD